MKKQSPASKMIKLIMAFAIFWMVIGDLITYHQAKIFGVHFFDNHSPFSKPKTKDDGKATFYSFGKAIDKNNHADSNCFLASIDSSERNSHIGSRSFVFRLLQINPPEKLLYTRRLLRGPPTSILS